MSTFGKMATDRGLGINYERMRAYRLARTKEQMEKAGIGTLISWDAYNIRYIAGVQIAVTTRWMESQFVVLPKNGEPYVFAYPSFSTEKNKESLPWLNGKVFPSRGLVQFASGPGDIPFIVDEVMKIIAEHGLTNEPLGLDGTKSEVLVSNAFASKGIKTVSAKGAMFEARKIKNQDEIECHKMAASNAEAAFDDMVKAIRPGVMECELVGVGMKALYSRGCDEAQEFVVASGPRTNPLWIDYTDRQIRPGELVVIDVCGNSFQGYKSCYYRTFSCGRATQAQKDTYEECRAMLYAGMAGIKAGNSTWDVAKHWPQSASYWGYDDKDPFDTSGLAFGHGIGISLHELPVLGPMISQIHPMTLEEGMVIAVETFTGKRGGDHGVRLEEDIVVTKDGYELLTKYPVDQITECGV